MVQLYNCLVMFLLHVIIIPYESLFLKMRNSHSLLKVLNSYSLAKCNQLCLTKFLKSPTTRIFFKIASLCSVNKNPKIPHYPHLLQIPSPCSINKILIIPHYLHLFQNFFSFLNFLSPLSKILFSHYQRSIYMGIVFLSPSVAALSSQGNCFFLSSLRFAISTSIVPSASVVALSSQKKYFYPQICNFYRYCPLFPLFISISDLPYLIFVQLRGSMILRLETVTLISQPIWQQSISMIYIYIF